MRNAALIIAAAAVLALGLVLVQGADDGGSSTGAAVTTTEAAAPATTPAEATSTGPATPTTPRPEAKPKPAIPTVVFAGGEAKGGVKELGFEKGDEIRFRVRSDVADEIHVHGFDEYADVEAGKSVTLAFDARFDGVYEVEMHGSGTQVASLVIEP